MRRQAVAALLLLLVAGAASGQQPSATSGAVAFQRIDVTALPDVQIYFTLTDTSGRSVLGLAPADLEVMLDATPQPVSVLRSALEGGESLAVALLFDRSGSMKTGLDAARDAARDFLTRLSDGDQVAIVSFDDQVQLEVALTSDRAVLSEAVGRLDRGNDTALHDAILAGLAALRGAQTNRQAVVVFSDGKDTRSGASRAQAIEAAKAQGVPVYALGLPVESDRDALRDLAHATGGAHLQAASADELRTLYQLIAEQLRNQYYLRFASTFGADERWHRLSMSYSPDSTAAWTAERDFIASTGPGISADRMQTLQREAARGSLLGAVTAGAVFGLAFGLLLLALIKAARPEIVLVSLSTVGLLTVSTALGAVVGAIVQLADVLP